MKKVGSILFFLVTFSVLSWASVKDTTSFQPKAIYGKEAQTIIAILNNNHYSKIKFNDSLSSAILDQYVQSLDGSKSFFLKSDIQSFEKYRTTLDDLTQLANVDPAYEIYKVFRRRFDERMSYITTHLVNEQFDFTIDEEYETNREKEPWAVNEQELNDVWRKNIKNQALSLKLSGKKPEEMSKVLAERYERMNKAMRQFNSEDVFNIYMNTITEAYDPHTSYFSPKAAEKFKEQMTLSLEGIGARLQTDNDYTKIAEIIPGGPADKSTILKANDRIIGVAQGLEGDMVDVIGWRIDDVVKLIKGPKGTTVRLSYLPGETGLTGSSKEITLVREKIKLEDQKAKKEIVPYKQGVKDLKMGVITIPSFYMDWEAYQKGDPDYTSTSGDVKKLIKELQADKVDGLIIDLRNNGGGSLAEAIDLTGLFIKNGPVVQVKNSANRIEVAKDDDPSVLFTGPLVVMTNRFSASASEIFAGAIQDYNRGVVVGESTYGKGTVQTVVDLKRFIQPTEGEEVGELKITFQKFYRVTGSSTQHKGVTPDVKLPSPFDEEEYGESANPSALPWDEIRSTLYEKTPIVNKQTLATLNKSYQDRVKSDVQLNKFISDTNEARRTMKETKVSLNEAKRKMEMEEAERKRANTSLGTKLGDKETGNVSTPGFKMDDAYLRESVLILSELIVQRVG
ncbi:carboxy terminal-processing peptidase [Chryseotalea sanaruensis]|nr:carboxy terminal-processing peptidase [Chryseotalea sanaruensis]